jgi:hypothetical protein
VPSPDRPSGERRIIHRFLETYSGLSRVEETGGVFYYHLLAKNHCFEPSQHHEDQKSSDRGLKNRRRLLDVLDHQCSIGARFDHKCAGGSEHWPLLTGVTGKPRMRPRQNHTSSPFAVTLYPFYHTSTQTHLRLSFLIRSKT